MTMISNRTHFHSLFRQDSVRRFRMFNIHKVNCFMLHKVNCFMLVIELKSEFNLQSRKLG